MSDQRLKTIDTTRRGHGRRYTGLPVDEIGRDGCAISFVGYRARPEMIDIRPDDTVRWEDGERTIEATVVHVERAADTLRVQFAGAQVIPEELIYP